MRQDDIDCYRLRERLRRERLAAAKTLFRPGPTILGSESGGSD